MSDTRAQATSGMKAVALLIGWISIVQLDRQGPFNLPDTAYGAVVLTSTIAGIILAVSIWSNLSWMIYAYGAWLVLMVVGRVWHDTRIDPEPWRVALGGVILAGFLGVVGFFLRRDQQQTAAAGVASQNTGVSSG